VAFCEDKYQNKTLKAGRELFLEQTGKLIPWTQL
jgi:hypothetical protein